LFEVRGKAKRAVSFPASFAKEVGVYCWKGDQLGGDGEDLARQLKKEVQSAGRLQVGCEFDHVDAEFQKLDVRYG
jgi:hypothetical protein